MIYDITLIPGDGIGPSIMDMAVRVLEASGVRFAWDRQLAGMAAVDRVGTPMPDETVASIRNTRIAFKGPLTTPVGGGFRSVNVLLRQEFNLYANVRPAVSLPGVAAARKGVDIVTVRENTEGLYSGIEHYIRVEGETVAAESIAVVTRKSSENIIRYAFEYARRNNRRKVTLVHKANILKCTTGLFLETGRTIAESFPEIRFEDRIIDACAMELVMRPEAFDVIVTTNLFGDILSDLTAGLIGGLGLTAGANIGRDTAIFEAVHGSAPDIAEKNIANPTAVILSGAMMLDHLGEPAAAENVRKAVHGVIAEGKRVTPDLGGSATTAEMGEAVIEKLR